MRDYFKIALQYCHDVRSGVRTAGQLEKLAAKRFLNDLTRSGYPVVSDDPELEQLLKTLKVGTKPADIHFDYTFDIESARHACFFIETCPHTTGTLAKIQPNGKRHMLVMEPWQVFITVNIFGWLNPEGLRRFIYFYIEVAKKNGKSTWIAAVALYMAFIDGEPGAEVYSAATSREQANIIFGTAKTMVDYSPFMRQRFGIETAQYSIFQSSSNSVFKALSQDRGGTKDGLNVHMGVIDELHAHKDSSMYDIVADGIAARDQPLVGAISTAGDDNLGVCYRERSTVENVLRGKAKHEQYFGMIFCLDRGDDWKDPKNWPKANPNYGISVTTNYLEAKFKKVLISPSSEAFFRQKHLNEWVGALNGWISPSVWERCYKDVKLKELDGQIRFGGYDLASRLDLADWGELIPRMEPDGKIHWYAFVHSYINERVLETKEAINGEKRPDEYPVWRDNGWLIATPGESTDYKRIQRDIEDAHVRNPFYEIGHDPYHAEQLTANLLDEGVNVVEVPQKTEHLSPAMRWIEVLMAEGRFHHCGDPVFTWCATNVVVKEDAKENIFPRKISSAKKIDAMVAIIIAASRARFHDDESVFDLVPGQGGDEWDADEYISNMVVVRR